jgi:hypothetical protein
MSDIPHQARRSTHHSSTCATPHAARPKRYEKTEKNGTKKKKTIKIKIQVLKKDETKTRKRNIIIIKNIKEKTYYLKELRTKTKAFY